jgi:hypothetical protein
MPHAFPSCRWSRPILFGGPLAGLRHGNVRDLGASNARCLGGDCGVPKAANAWRGASAADGDCTSSPCFGSSPLLGRTIGRIGTSSACATPARSTGCRTSHFSRTWFARPWANKRAVEETLATFAYVQYAHKKTASAWAHRDRLCRTAAWRGLGRQPTSLYSDMS